MSAKPLSIVWFRQDLRISDNPALAYAAGRGAVVPVYILDETPPPNGRPIGAAARWWLHHSLAALSKSLGGLVVLRGDPAVLVAELCRRLDATGVYWNRCYEPYAIARDTSLKSSLTSQGIDMASFNASLLFEPWQVQTRSGGPFKVFTPFWRACRSLTADVPLPTQRVPLKIPKGLGDSLEDLHLLPRKPNWASGFHAEWVPGEAGAKARLNRFLEDNLSGYGEGRDRPGKPNVSRLSPHLHWGELSPRQIWAATHLLVDVRPKMRADGEKFLAEIGWREFCYHLLYHFPELPAQNWKPAFDSYPWSNNNEHLNAWRRGQTGYPLVDAGMRELWATGYMHNRVRMVAASFLVKHLRTHWREGEAWFWDTLLDADLASNAAGWQWVAGSGADAAPYFRIFNPILQSRKFDPVGTYIRRWCPELARLPNSAIHEPFEAPADVIKAAGVVLGATYPHPIVDHSAARRLALDGYHAMKAAGTASA